ncbi:MAG: prepilin-type N-terminal cleavage/methylation domain-containing protein [Acinetobacter sp.]
MLKSSKGFTLLELMVTLVIVAIFAAIAIPSYQYFIVKVRKSQAQTEMLKISERLENYRSKQLTYAGYIPEHQNAGSGQKGIVNLPYGSSSSEYDYQLIIMDTNPLDATKLSLEDATIGQGWKIIAIPNQNKNMTLKKSGSLLLNSLGLKCMMPYDTNASVPVLESTSNDCGANTKDW